MALHQVVRVVAVLEALKGLVALLAAAGNALVRFVAASGQFRQRSWAEWLAAGSGAIYIPMEVFELLRGPNWLGAALLLLNVAIVALMICALLNRRAALGAGSRLT